MKKKDSTMNDADESLERVARKPRVTRRRKLVKTIAASGGVAATTAAGGHWIKPAVNSVVLPTHATTSFPQRAIVDVEVVASIMNHFIAAAYAAPAVDCALPSSFCVDRPTTTSIVITIEGVSSGVINYTDSVAIAGPIDFNLPDSLVISLTNIVIVGDQISCNIACAQPDKSPINTNVSGVFVSGSCALIQM